MVAWGTHVTGVERNCILPPLLVPADYPTQLADARPHGGIGRARYLGLERFCCAAAGWGRALSSGPVGAAEAMAPPRKTSRLVRHQARGDPGARTSATGFRALFL